MTERIKLIDALRGIAALGVMLHHYGERVGWTNAGNLGVPIFFVLSGFVIAMSVGNQTISARYLGWFALRRSLRLDPPYWLTIAAVLVIGYLGARYGINQSPASAGQVAAHLFYLQDWLGFKQIQVIYWTLCYEIQFYLALILLLWGSRAVGMPVLAVLGTLCLSLVDRHYELTNAAFMGRFWFCFAVGALTHWVVHGEVRGRQYFLALLIVGVFGLRVNDPYAITTVVTSLVIWAAVVFGRADLGSHASFQFFGRISYSLYLTHLIGGWLVLSLAMKVMPGWLALVVGSLAAILSAWVFYLLAEAPSIKLSRVLT